VGNRHNQLKNYISTAKPNIIYYASAYDIFALNVSSRKRTLVKSLPWKPFCLDAACGWIGVGGDENGQCAFVSINETDVGGASSQSRAEVDDLLPLDLNPEYRHIRHDFRRTPPWPQYSSEPKYELQHREFGGERVNSIKIHSLSSANGNVKNEIVAVLT